MALGAGEAALLMAKQLINGEDAARGGKGPGWLSALAGQAEAVGSTFLLRNAAPTPGFGDKEASRLQNLQGMVKKQRLSNPRGGRKEKYSFDQPEKNMRSSAPAEVIAISEMWAARDIVISNKKNQIVV